MSKAPNFIEFSPNLHLCLLEVFKKRRVDENIILNIFDGILKGNIIPAGRAGNDIPDIFFTKQQISDLLNIGELT